MIGGRPVVCVPRPGGGGTRPCHHTADINGGGPHGLPDAIADVDGGRMDGCPPAAKSAG
jgi:hypothetical protein